MSSADLALEPGPDGGGRQTLVFASFEFEGDKIMRTDGSHQSVVLAGTNGQPSLSQGGRVYETLFVAGNDDVWSMKKDGTDQVRLTTDAAEDIRPCVSPDASRIAFVSNRDGNNEIYVMDGDGSNQTRLTNNAATDRRPAWSPDGAKIVFSSDRDGDQDLWTMDANGSNVVQLVNSDSTTDLDASYKLDGSAIFYTASPVGGGNARIVRINPDGTGAVFLTDGVNDEFKTATWVY